MIEKRFWEMTRIFWIAMKILLVGVGIFFIGLCLLNVNDKNNRKFTVLQSMGHEFYIYYGAYSRGVDLPDIDIKTDTRGVRWLYLMQQEGGRPHIIPNVKIHNMIFEISDLPEYQNDSIFMDKLYADRLFYSLQEDFLDNIPDPLIHGRHSCVGHAYAVQVSNANKTIECVGGVSWGFRWPWWWSLQPVMIRPAALTSTDWQTDWLIFEKALREYKDVSKQ